MLSHLRPLLALLSPYEVDKASLVTSSTPEFVGLFTGDFSSFKPSWNNRRNPSKAIAPNTVITISNTVTNLPGCTAVLCAHAQRSRAVARYWRVGVTWLPAQRSQTGNSINFAPLGLRKAVELHHWRVSAIGGCACRVKTWASNRQRSDFQRRARIFWRGVLRTACLPGTGGGPPSSVVCTNEFQTQWTNLFSSLQVGRAACSWRDVPTIGSPHAHALLHSSASSAYLWYGSTSQRTLCQASWSVRVDSGEIHSTELASRRAIIFLVAFFFCSILSSHILDPYSRKLPQGLFLWRARRTDLLLVGGLAPLWDFSGVSDEEEDDDPHGPNVGVDSDFDRKEISVHDT